jgi:hypothetical protein
MFSSFFKSNLSYEIDVDLEIVTLRFLGEISTSSITKIKKKVIHDPIFKKGFNWIIDLRKSKSMFAPNRVDPLFEFYKENAELFQHVKIAYIIENPAHSVSVESVIHLFKINNIQVEIRKEVNPKLAYDWIIS